MVWYDSWIDYHIVSSETILFWIWPYVLWPKETIHGRKLFNLFRPSLGTKWSKLILYLRVKNSTTHLTLVYKIDEEWCKLQSRKKSLKNLYEQCREFHHEKICQFDSIPEDYKYPSVRKFKYWITYLKSMPRIISDWCTDFRNVFF